MMLEIIPEKQSHWTWDDSEAKKTARDERAIARLANNPITLALASTLAIGAREAALMLFAKARKGAKAARA